MNEADDQCAGMTQFNFTGRQNVPQQGMGQLCDSASSMQPDLSLSLSFSSLARPPFSLRNRLEINEGAPPPPRDFLSLSMSSSTLQPTAPGPLQQPPHQSLFQQELQTVPFLEYQRRIIEETQRRLLEQMMAPERLMLPPMQQQMLTVPPGLQRRSQQVVFPTLVLPHQQLTGLPPVGRHQQQQQVMATPLPQPQQQVSVVSASQGLSPSLVPSGMAVEIASVLKHRAFRRAMNYLQTGHSSGTINIPAEGSSSSISTQTNLAPTPAANKGKQPLLPGSETSPIVISSPSSSEAVLVEHAEPKSVAKKMRLMREKGWEDWIQLKSKTAPSGELKLGCDADEKVTEGFLYRYYTGEISIVCSCHGVFLTPAEFVAHAAGDDADKL